MKAVIFYAILAGLLALFGFVALSVSDETDTSIADEAVMVIWAALELAWSARDALMSVFGWLRRLLGRRKGSHARAEVAA